MAPAAGGGAAGGRAAAKPTTARKTAAKKTTARKRTASGTGRTPSGTGQQSSTPAAAVPPQQPQEIPIPAPLARGTTGAANTGAGVVLGVVGYALLVNYLHGGMKQVKEWVKAKFINDVATSVTSSKPSKPSKPSQGR